MDRKINNSPRKMVRHKPISDIKLIVFDIDKTLITPNDPGYYKQFSTATERAIATHRQVDLAIAKQIANHYRTNYGGGEYALFIPPDQDIFTEYPSPGPNYSILYEELVKIDPSGFFYPRPKTVGLLKSLKSRGIKIIALTNSIQPLAKRSLILSSINPQFLFDAFISFTKKSGPPKTIFGSKIFQSILNKFNTSPHQALSIGDSLRHDIQPAQKIGMHTCLIGPTQTNNYSGYYLNHVTQLPDIIKQ